MGERVGARRRVVGLPSVRGWRLSGSLWLWGPVGKPPLFFGSVCVQSEEFSPSW